MIEFSRPVVAHDEYRCFVLPDIRFFLFPAFLRYHEVDVADRFKDYFAVVVRQKRFFVLARVELVCGKTHDEVVPHFARAAQEIDVPGMQKVVCAVGDDCSHGYVRSISRAREAADEHSILIPMFGVNQKKIQIILGLVVIALAAGVFFNYLSANSSARQNILLVGWDGAERSAVYTLLKNGSLPNLQKLIDEGSIVGTTITKGRTETKPGWAEILTGDDAGRAHL